MNTILTDDEISSLQMQTILEYHESDKMTHGWLMLSRKVEAAVLAKLREQEPIYQYQMHGGAWIDQTRDSYEYNLKQPTAKVRVVYAAPQPAVVQVPQGWKLVPVEPTTEMLGAADREHAARGLVSIALISYRAMLAAAPEAPAQSKEKA